MLVPDWMINEKRYAVSRTVAEFYCTISMLPLLFVGLYWSTTFPLGGSLCIAAAFASAIYHAMPYKWLLRLDQLCAALLIIYALASFDSSLWIFYVIPLLLLCIDTSCRYFNLFRIPFIHPIWHLCGALCVHMIISSWEG